MKPAHASAEETTEGGDAMPFAKDFGYLGKFLVAVDEHARGVEGPRGDRLRALMSGEVAKWRAIEALLRGAEPAPGDDGARQAPVASSNPAGANSVGTGRSEASARAPGRPGLTVGSLRQPVPARRRGE